MFRSDGSLDWNYPSRDLSSLRDPGCEQPGPPEPIQQRKSVKPCQHPGGLLYSG